MNWQKFWQDIVNFFTANVWQIILFFVVLLAGIVAIKLILNITRRMLRRTKMEPIAVGFLMAILKFLLYFFLVICLLSLVGIAITGIVTALSAIFLAVGLALQDNIANLANGMIIVSGKMFKKGDYIAVDGVEGSIDQINFLYVTLITPDNKRITLPNSKILNQVVVNYDSNSTRRVSWEFCAAYESDVDQVKQIILDCLRSNGLVMLDPAPSCRLAKMGDSGLIFNARAWCDKEDYWTVYYDIMETVFNEFKRHQINIPYNQLEIRQRTDTPVAPVSGTGLPERVAKQRQTQKHFDLEEADLSEIFKRPRRGKERHRNGARTGVRADGAAD